MSTPDPTLPPHLTFPALLGHKWKPTLLVSNLRFPSGHNPIKGFTQLTIHLLYPHGNTVFIIRLAFNRMLGHAVSIRKSRKTNQVFYVAPDGAMHDPLNDPRR